MSTDLTFITNEENQNLLGRFQVLIKDTRFFDGLVGYFYSSRFFRLYPSLEPTEKNRILIGIRTDRQTFQLIRQTHHSSQLSLQFSHFDVTTYPAILLVEKRPPLASEKATTATFTEPSQLERVEETLDQIGFPMPIHALKEEGWNLESQEVQALMEKLRAVGVPLGEYVKGRFYRGVLTGLNEAFVIDDATRKKLISEDPKSAELIKPWLRGRDIRKWKTEWAGLYLINIPSSANKKWPWSDAKTETEAQKGFKKTYPAIFQHLKSIARSGRSGEILVGAAFLCLLLRFRKT